MDTDGTALRIWHLRYRYGKGQWLKAAETHGLRRDHREILLEVLRRHFEQREPGRFQFDYFDPSTLTPLERARPTPGPLETGTRAQRLTQAISTTANPLGELSDEQRRAVLVRDVEAMIVREIRSLDQDGVLRETSRDDLIEHLMSLDLANPAWPSDDPAFRAMGAAKRSERAGTFETVGQAATTRTAPPDDSNFRPASAFPKGMASRLRMAARPERRSKRVATRRIDGVVCYSMNDARRWWPDDVK